MPSRAELLVCECQEDDLAILRSACGPGGPAVRIVDSPVKLAHEVVLRGAVAVVLGASTDTETNLDVISLVRAIRPELPVIVVARDDALSLERSAREKGIFYYLVHPIDRPEVEAVLRDVLRQSRS